jgi:hypothetical protein
VLRVVIGLIVLLAVVVLVVSFLRSAFGVLRGDDQIEPRSFGRQFSKRHEDDKPGPS